jgi:hypothetical protein
MLIFSSCRFEFFGKAAHAYLLFGAKTFAVAMTMSREAVHDHYIGAVNVTYHNASLTITIGPTSARELRAFNSLLRPLGGKV